MNLKDAIDLIRPVEPFVESRWADLGCGSGLFTHALATLLPSGSSIYAVDQYMNGFMESHDMIDVPVIPIEMNFESDKLPFDNLDGILMANSLHFVKDKEALIRKLERSFADDRTFMIVEYDTDIPNRWVPYPVSFVSLKKLFHQSGYFSVTRLNEKRSLFQRGNLYSAIIRQK